MAGALVAYTLLVRSQNAVYVYAGFAVYFLLFKKFRELVIFTLPFLFFGGVLMWYNWFFTGDPASSLFRMLFLMFLTVENSVTGLVLAKAVPPNHGDHLPPGGTDLKFLAGINFLRLNSFSDKNYSSSGTSFLYSACCF